jgi:general secretion pathway protein D
LSELPVIGALFANNRRESQQTDIILTLTPRIVRVLNLTAADLAPFRVGRDSGAPMVDLPLPNPLPLPPKPGADPDADQPSPFLPSPTKPAQPIKPPPKPPGR